jgi:RIO-like serine/threonine protein kinase
MKDAKVVKAIAAFDNREFGKFRHRVSAEILRRGRATRAYSSSNSSSSLIFSRLRAAADFWAIDPVTGVSREA